VEAHLSESSSGADMGMEAENAKGKKKSAVSFLGLQINLVNLVIHTISFGKKIY